MNERIKALAEKSGAGWDDKYHWYISNDTIEKFAELLLDEIGFYLLENGITNTMEVIDMKRHFGV